MHVAQCTALLFFGTYRITSTVQLIIIYFRRHSNDTSSTHSSNYHNTYNKLTHVQYIYIYIMHAGLKDKSKQKRHSLGTVVNTVSVLSSTRLVRIPLSLAASSRAGGGGGGSLDITQSREETPLIAASVLMTSCSKNPTYLPMETLLWCVGGEYVTQVSTGNIHIVTYFLNRGIASKFKVVRPTYT